MRLQDAAGLLCDDRTLLLGGLMSVGAAHRLIAAVSGAG